MATGSRLNRDHKHHNWSEIFYFTNAFFLLMHLISAPFCSEQHLWAYFCSSTSLLYTSPVFVLPGSSSCTNRAQKSIRDVAERWIMTRIISPVLGKPSLGGITLTRSITCGCSTRLSGCISLGTIHTRINQYLGSGLEPSRAQLPHCISQKEIYGAEPVNLSVSLLCVRSRSAL